MSAPWAVAAITLALRNFLQREIPLRDPELVDLTVTTRAPDMARKTLTGTSLNVFLYDSAANAAWQNQLPRPGGPATAQLALNLHYLLTAYGRDDADPEALSHRVLGAAMALMHENPVLSAAELSGAVANSRVAEQSEPIKITALPLGLDELSKLWTAAQSNMRASAAYELSVLLIDGAGPVPVPLPVLTRGSDDQGVQTVLGAAPALAAMVPPRSQPAARQGETVLVQGSGLAVAGTLLRFRSLRNPPPPLPAPVDLIPQPGPEPGQLAVTVPDRAADPLAWGRWVPGFYAVAAVATGTGAAPLHSNAVAFALAPAITVSPHSPAAVTAGGTVTLTCSPRIGAGQNVAVLCGDAAITPETVVNPAPGDPAIDATPTTVTFKVPALPAGNHPVRLRVDGVDSIPVDFTAAVPGFDPAQQVSLP